MAKLAIRLTCLFAMLVGGLAVAGTAPASAAPASGDGAVYSCLSFGTTDGIHTGGDDNNHWWGWAQTVHSPACNHWGSVALNQKLPSGYQVNVTLTRWNGDFVFDHRYCYVKAGGTNCHTEAILTTACFWSYTTNAQIYHWNGSAWDLIAFNTTPPRSASCTE